MINEQYIASHGLKECLYAFCGAGNGSIDAKMFILKTEFFHLAQKMLYGGFLQVGDDYEIYIRTVEFYYHEEEESENQIKDPIVYHRNGRFPGRDLPPFSMMCLHAHWSGYDITFQFLIAMLENTAVGSIGSPVRTMVMAATRQYQNLNSTTVPHTCSSS